MDVKDREQVLGRAMSYLKLALRKELRDQGHVLTGDLERSIDYEIRQVGDIIQSEMSGNDYGDALNDGVKAGSIPYTRGSGATESEYIDGLIRNFKFRGKSEEEAKRAAFATANTQKKDGMPTRGSMKYSKNGRRTGFIDHVLINDYEKVAELIDYELASWLDNIVTELVRPFSK